MVKVTCTAFGDVTFQSKAYHYTYFIYLFKDLCFSLKGGGDVLA